MDKKDYKSIKRFLSYVKPSKRRAIHLFFWISFAALLRLPMPILTKYIIDNVFSSKKMSTLNIIGLAMIAFYLINYFSQIIKSYLLINFKEKIMYFLQIKFFRHILSLSTKFFHEQKTGNLLSRLTNDTNKIGAFFSDNVFGLLLDVLTFMFGISIMFYYHWKLSAICLLLLPFYLYAMMGFGAKIKQASSILQEDTAKMQGNLQESLAGIITIKSFTRENFEAIKHSRFWRTTIKSRIKLTLLLYISTITVATIGSLGPLIVLWYGGSQVISGHMTIGEMVAFSSFLNYLFGPIQKMTTLNFQLKDALAALERIYTILDMKPEIIDKVDARGTERVRSFVKYENVNFSYIDGVKVLDGINFEANPGEILAIVGKSGAGKSTMLRLVFRFFDPQQGNIYIDGINIKDFKIKSLRMYVAAVNQDTFLFDGSIYDNIRYGSLHAGEEEIRNALKIGNSHDFIEKLPDGYKTKIGERGVKLSGGQKQRLDIARAIIRGARILIFDEATAFLDSESEFSIQQALQKLKTDRTIFVIAHKLSTILQADRILVLDHGKIVAQGTHEQLYNDSDVYKDIFDQQLHLHGMETIPITTNEFSIKTEALVI